MRNKKSILLLIFIAIASLNPANLKGQENIKQCNVKLMNGELITGRLINETPKKLTLVNNGDTLAFSKHDILEISFENKKYPKPQEIKNVQDNNKGNKYINKKVIKADIKIKEKDSHFIIGLGYGNSYGGFGIQPQYKYKSIAIHGGFGYFPASFVGGSEYNLNDEFLCSGGIKIYFGKSDVLLYMDAQYGAFGVYEFSYSYVSGYNNYTDTYNELIFGPSFIFGCDIYFNKTIGINGGIGISYNNKYSELEPIWLALDIGLLFKF